jgi:hypothetical protein
MSKFRKKPVVIEAFQIGRDNLPDWFMDRVSDLTVILHGGPQGLLHQTWCEIKTLEGVMRADPGDWIIRGVKGELYPCKPDIFDATYEPVA